MRAFILILPMAALAACAAPTPQTIAPAEPDVAIAVPMDPGTLSCAALSNSNAMIAARDWTMGRARAAALSGQIAAVPDEAVVASNLAMYCSANQGARLRDAAAQLGF